MAKSNGFGQHKSNSKKERVWMLTNIISSWLVLWQEWEEIWLIGKSNKTFEIVIVLTQEGVILLDNQFLESFNQDSNIGPLYAKKPKSKIVR